jgi:hypothetical protein
MKQVALPILESDLQPARRALWREQFRSALFAGTETAIRIGAASAGVFAVFVVLHRLAGISLTWLVCTIVAGAIAVLANFGGRLVSVLLAPPSFAEAAERLDLGTHGHNGIAAALEFASRPSPSPFELVAIGEGFCRLQAVREVMPILPRRQQCFRRDIAWICLAIAMLAVAAVIPGPATLSVASTRDATFAPQPSLPTSVALHHEPSPIPRNDRSVAPVPPHPGGESASPTQTRRGDSEPQADSNASAAAGGSAGEVGAASGGATTTDDASQAKPGTGASEQLSAAGKGSPGHSTPPRPQLAQKSNVSGGAGASPAPAGGEAKDKNKPAPAKNGDAPPEGSGSGSGGGGEPPPDVKADAGNGGEGGGAPKESLPPGGSGISHNAQDATSSEGNGRASGQSPPKKSRGVAPLLLGTRRPDLFQVRPLPGPDDRTKFEVPSQRDPGGPALPAAAPARVGDEQPQAAYQVPAELRAVVDEYFARLHAEAETSRPVEKK